MKKMFAAFALLAGFFSLSVSGFADTLQLVNATGQVSDGIVSYPYNFSIDGSSSLTSLMCIDFNREITLGETWAVTRSGLPMDNSPASIQLRADAWIYAQLGSNSSSDVQYAVWDILDPADVEGHAAFNASAKMLSAEGMQMAQSASLVASGFFAGYDLYVPTGDMTGWTDGVPQRFVGVAVAPEPSSLLLLATGLLVVAACLRRSMPSGRTPARLVAAPQG